MATKTTPSFTQAGADPATQYAVQHTSYRAVSPIAQRSLAALRVAYGLTFLWAFFDKVLGLGFATKPADAWIRGGNPTAGFLQYGTTGPLHGFYGNLAGQWWVSPLFMIGLFGIGTALTFGIGMRLAAIAGGLLYVFMWTSLMLPVNNPVIDEHVLGLLALVALWLTGAGDTWGFGKQWRESRLVQRWRFLR